MSKSLQDAYIVAATRSPVGKAPRGMLKNVRPDEQGMNVARIGLLLAGLPDTVPGMTLNRFCSSGLQAVADAAARIRLGEADVMIAAGTESMSMVPMGGNKPSFSPDIFAKDENVGIAYGMGITAERVAAQWKVSREDQDRFAAESHRRAVWATDGGEFKNEITPYDINDRLPDLKTREITVKTRRAEQDEGRRVRHALEPQPLAERVLG